MRQPSSPGSTANGPTSGRPFSRRGAREAVARQILGPKAPPPATFKVERWSMTPRGETTLLTFHLAGGTQLCLEVTPETVRDGEGP